MAVDFPGLTKYAAHQSSPKEKLVLIPLCRKGDRAGIEKALAEGASLDEMDIEGNTALHVAVEAPRNEIATVQCLLEHGARVDAANYIGATPLHYVSLRRSGYRGVANVLLENGADVNACTTASKTTLHFACERNLLDLVEVLLLFGADPTSVDAEGNTPPHSALIKEGRDTVKRSILEALLSSSKAVASCSGAASNSEGMAPLHLACKNGFVRCLQCLVEHQCPVVSCTSFKQETGLHVACAGGHSEVTQLMLQAHPSAVDTMDSDGNTPLHRCAIVGSLDCAMLLLKSGADTSVKNNQKKTAHELAKMRGTDLNSTHNPELAQLLKDANKGSGCRAS